MGVKNNGQLLPGVGNPLKKLSAAKLCLALPEWGLDWLNDPFVAVGGLDFWKDRKPISKNSTSES